MEDGDAFTVAFGGIFEGVAGDARAGGFGGDFEAGDDAGHDFVFDAAVEALGVFANDDQVNIFVAGFDTGESADGSDGGVEAEFLAELDVDGFEALADGRGDGAFEGDFVLLDGADGFVGEDVGETLVDGGLAGGHFDPVGREAGGIDDSAGGAVTSGPMPSPGMRTMVCLGMGSILAY